MFENTTNLQFQVDMMDEGLLILRAYIVPMLRKQPGLLSLAIIPHRNLNRVIILSLWASPACARAIESVLEYRQQIQKLDEMLLDKTHSTEQEHAIQKIKVRALSPN